MIFSGPVLSEVASGSLGSIRSGGSGGPAGVSWGTSAVSNADVSTTVASAAASAHDGASTATSNTRSHPRVRPSRKSHTSTAKDHRSKANANNSTGAISVIRPTSYATGAGCAPPGALQRLSRTGGTEALFFRLSTDNLSSRQLGEKGQVKGPGLLGAPARPVSGAFLEPRQGIAYVA
jgi:hypothetical protein